MVNYKFKYVVEVWVDKEVPNTTWTVLGYDRKKNKSHQWFCRCRCGRESSIRSSSLFNGRSLTCRSCSKDKGGFLDKKGYNVVHRDHPNNWMSGQMFEHVWVMSEHQGRPLTEGETVHHINGVRNDNRLENLQLRSSNHGAGQSYACLDCGSNRIHPIELAGD